MERKRSVKRRQKQPLAQRAKEQCRKFTAFMFSNVGIIILVVLYMTAGAFMFTAIEGSIALERWAEIARNRQTLAHHLWNVSSCELNGLNRSMFEEEVGKKILDYQQTIVRAARKGWPGSDARGEGRKQWSFSGAFLYSLTVITTIGYGNLAPRTEWGKVATILYAIIGMPLFLLYLSNIGDIFAKSFKWIYAKVCLCRICPGVAKRRAIRQRRKQIRARTLYSSESEDEDSIRNPSQSRDYHVKGVLDGLSSNNSYSTQMSDDDDFEDAIEKEIEGATSTVTVPLTICLMIMIGYIIIGATIFGRWEDWNMLDGCYFCFISLSSIGFGDIVPGEEIMQISKGINSGVELRFILCAVYLLLGMALIAMCFNLMQVNITKIPFDLVSPFIIPFLL